MIKTVFLVVISGFCWAQNQPFNPGEDFLSLAEPIITQEEKAIYESLATYPEKDYFESIFWFKRDPAPKEAGNIFRKDYFSRRNLAVSDNRFREGSTSPLKTARGQIFLLMGEPDDVNSEQTASGIYIEMWRYTSIGESFRFVLEPSSNRFRLDLSGKPNSYLEDLKRKFILDRAVSYRLKTSELALPNIGSTKDIENLVAEDRMDIPVQVRYSAFQGDHSQTQILVGLTFLAPARTNFEVNFTAYDPYDNKVVDFKKRMKPTPHEFEYFFVVMEPDHYDFVLRIQDNNRGLSSVIRQTVDVPRLFPEEDGFSSVILSDGWRRIPLEGFHEPTMFIQGDRFFRPQVSFKRNHGDVLLLQFVYGQERLPNKIVVSGKDIKLDLGKDIVEGGIRWHQMIPASAFDSSNPTIHVHYAKGNGVDRVFATSLSPEGQKGKAGQARWISPSPAKAEQMGLVQVEPEGRPDRVDLLLNGRVLYSKSEAPYRFTLDPELYSISGDHRLTARMWQGAVFSESHLDVEALRADEQVKTRAIQVFFNAFNENTFVSNLDLNQVSITVEGEPQEPLEMEKIEDPITYCFLVDTSYSMKDAFFTNMSAIKKFLENIRPQDQGYFIGFNENYHQMNQPTPYKGVLLAAANSLTIQNLNPSSSDAIYQENRTYLYDAIIAGIHSLNQYPGRKVVVVISDGISTEGIFPPNAMFNYAAENDVVIYSLWIDNNPDVNDEELAFFMKEMGGGERFARAIGLNRFFANKDQRRNKTKTIIRNKSINQGALKILAEESGGFHYRIFKSDRNLIKSYVDDISSAVGAQYRATLTLPVSEKRLEVDVTSKEESVAIRCKSAIKVRKTNPLSD